MTRIPARGWSTPGTCLRFRCLVGRAGDKVHLFTAIFLLLFTGFIARNVVWHGNLFLENLQAQFKLEHQTEIISLLLKDFQEMPATGSGKPTPRPG